MASALTWSLLWATLSAFILPAQPQVTGYCFADDPMSRINCGNPGISQQECRANGCCFDPSIGGVSWCFLPSTTTPGTCNNVRDRVDCGFSGINEATCLSRGCCFDESPGNNFCYFRQRSPDLCFVDPTERVDCGVSGISQADCEDVGCCYDNSQDNTYHCFFDLLHNRVTQPLTCPPTEPSGPPDCPVQDVSAERCHLAGCCAYPAGSQNPTCYIAPELETTTTSTTTTMPPTSTTEPTTTTRATTTTPTTPAPSAEEPTTTEAIPTEEPTTTEALPTGFPEPADQVLVTAGPAGLNIPSELSCWGKSYPAGVLLNITWTVNNAQVYNKIVPSPDNSSQLPIQQIPNMNGNPEIKCCVSAVYNPSSATGEPDQVCSELYKLVSATVTSPTEDNLVLVEGDEIQVEFQLSGFPNLMCGATGQSLTRVIVEVEDPPTRSCGPTASYKIPQVAVSYGNVNLGVCERSFIVSGPVNQTETIRVAGLVDGRDEEEMTVTLSVRVEKIVGSTICTYPVGEFEVKVTDAGGSGDDDDDETPSKCHIGYPFNIISFNGDIYQSSIPGVFHGFRHTNGRYEWHFKTKAVTVTDGTTEGKVVTPCAVSVRVDDDLLLLTRCGSDSDDKLAPTMSAYSTTTFPKTPGFDYYVSSSESLYTVFFPHGAKLTVFSGNVGPNGFVDIIYLPSVLDAGMVDTTASVCGQYMNPFATDPTGMLIEGDLYVNTFRVRSDISTTLTIAPIDTDNWCECRYDLTGVNCVGTPYERCTSGLLMIGALIERPLSPDVRAAWTDGGNNAIGTLSPGLSGPDLQNAQSACTNLLTSTPVAQACSVYLGDNPAARINLCVYLYAITDDQTATRVMVESLKGECLVALGLLPTLPYGATDLLNKLCLNDCGEDRGYGRCNLASCICNSGYVGPDCSMARDSSTPPELESVVGGSVCSISTSQAACDTVTFTGTFDPSLTYTCLITYVDPETGGTLYTAELPAAGVLSSQLTCPLPSGQSALISVRDSNGLESQQTLPFLAVDPSCLTCNVAPDASFNCQRTTGGCLIYGVCRQPNFRHIADSCYYCDPTLNAKGWSRRNDDTCPSENVSTVSNGMFLGMVIASVLLVLFIIIVCCFCCCRVGSIMNRRDRDQDSVEVYDSMAGSDQGLYAYSPRKWSVYGMRDAIGNFGN